MPAPRRCWPSGGARARPSERPETLAGQTGRRPALALTPRPFNDRVGVALVCPITSRVKGYPFEVAVAGVRGLEGVVLVDQLRSLDWRARQAEQAGRAPATVMDEVLAKLRALIGV